MYVAQLLSLDAAVAFVQAAGRALELLAKFTSINPSVQPGTVFDARDHNAVQYLFVQILELAQGGHRANAC